MPNFGGQFGVGAGLPAQFGQLLQQFAMAGVKARHAERVFAIEYAAVGQNQAHAGQGVIAVLRRAAAHAAGVVSDDTADFAGVDRGRIGADFALQRGQHGVRLGADHARLQTDLRAAFEQFAAVPIVAENDQYRVADGLAR